MNEDTPLSPEDEAVVAEAVESMKDVTTIGTYVPPSTTVIRTKQDGWYYLPITFREAVELVTSADTWAEFETVGNEATRVTIRTSEITAVVDLTPVAEETP
jgi:hypothetical protein